MMPSWRIFDSFMANSSIQPWRYLVRESSITVVWPLQFDYDIVKFERLRFIYGDLSDSAMMWMKLVSLKFDHHDFFDSAMMKLNPRVYDSAMMKLKCESVRYSYGNPSNLTVTMLSWRVYESATVTSLVQLWRRQVGDLRFSRNNLFNLTITRSKLAKSSIRPWQPLRLDRGDPQSEKTLIQLWQPL